MSTPPKVVNDSCQKLPYGFVMTCPHCLCDVWFHKDQRPVVRPHNVDAWEVVCTMCEAVFRFRAELEHPK